MNTEEVDQLISAARQMDEAQAIAAMSALAKIKHQANVSNDEALAKWCWTREEAITAHQLYREAFRQIKGGQSYGGWCTLEKAEITLKFARPHIGDDEWRAFGLEFVIRQIQHWQSVFPYKIFASPEIVHHEKLCSICKNVLSLRSGCGHRKGEVYQGELCHHVITKPELLSVSFVTKPVQKYSVAFAHDPSTGKHRDQYNYAVVQYVARGLRTPYDGWAPHLTTARHPHSRYKHIGRNGACPCESGRKYKICCLSESGVLRPHMDIEFEVMPEAGFPEVEYSD